MGSSSSCEAKGAALSKAKSKGSSGPLRSTASKVVTPSTSTPSPVPVDAARPANVSRQESTEKKELEKRESMEKQFTIKVSMKKLDSEASASISKNIEVKEDSKIVETVPEPESVPALQKQESIKKVAEAPASINKEIEVKEDSKIVETVPEPESVSALQKQESIKKVAEAPASINKEIEVKNDDASLDSKTEESSAKKDESLEKRESEALDSLPLGSGSLVPSVENPDDQENEDENPETDINTNASGNNGEIKPKAKSGKKGKKRRK